MKKEFSIFTDGACSGNPGEAGIGAVIEENGDRVKEISRSIGQATNNIAEYAALIYALQEALMLKGDVLTVHTDSELLYKQVIGAYKIKNQNLKFLCDLVQHLLTGFEKVEFRHVPRGDNHEADQLATRAIKERQQTKKDQPVFIFGEQDNNSG